MKIEQNRIRVWGRWWDVMYVIEEEEGQREFWTTRVFLKRGDAIRTVRVSGHDWPWANKTYGVSWKMNSDGFDVKVRVLLDESGAPFMDGGSVDHPAPQWLKDALADFSDSVENRYKEADKGVVT